MDEVRWKYRFDNYSKAFLILKKALTIDQPSEVEKAGIIQFYEMVFELAWKTLKDYLMEEGFDVKSPRASIKQAIQMEVIDGGHEWMEALEGRNLTAHTYDEGMANRVYTSIKDVYFPLLDDLYQRFQDEL